MSYNSKYTGAEVEALLDASNGKQDIIKDLDVIRSGAAAGATALQVYVTSFSVEDIYNAKYNGVGIDDGDKEDIIKAIRDGKKIATYWSEIEGFYLADATLEGSEMVVTYPALNIIIDTFTTDARIYPEDVIINNYITAENLASVATSGSYNDLSNKPTIEEEGETFILGDGVISSNDEHFYLPSKQTEDIAHVLATKGDIPSVYKWQWNGDAGGTLEEGEFEKILNADIVLVARGENGYMLPALKNTAGNATVTLGVHYGFETALQSYTFAMFASGAWSVMAQSFAVGSGASYPMVEVTELNDFTLSPNTYYKAPALANSVSVQFGEERPGVVNEYIFEFGVVGSVSLSMPDGVVWANRETPPMTDGKVYVISVVDDLAVFAEF